MSSTTSLGRLMIAVLGRLADVERDLIRTRTAEGRSRAKAKVNWQHMGASPSSRRSNRPRPGSAAPKGRRSRGLADSYNVGVATIARLGSP